MASIRPLNHHDVGKEEDLMTTTIHEATIPELLKSKGGVLTPMVPGIFSHKSKVVWVLSGFHK
jgi:hypothetical protein